MSPLFLGRHGHELNKRVALLHINTQPGGDLGTATHVVSSLLAINSVGMPGLNRRQHPASASVKLPASTTNKIRSTSPMAPITVLFSDLFQRRCYGASGTGGIDKHKLRRPGCECP